MTATSQNALAQLEQRIAEQDLQIDRLTNTLKGLGELLTSRFAKDDLAAKQHTQQIAQVSKLFTDLSEKIGTTVTHETVARICAEQLQMLFQNKVMLDSISHVIFNNAANAIAYKAQSSEERPPKIMLVKSWFPGVQRIRHNEDGTILLEGQNNPTDPDSGWLEDVSWKDIPHGEHALVELLQSYGAEAGQMLYLTDDISYGHHRENLHTQLQAAAERRAREEAIARGEDDGLSATTAAEEGLVDIPAPADSAVGFDSFPETEDASEVSGDSGDRDVLSQIAAL